MQQCILVKISNSSHYWLTQVANLHGSQAVHVKPVKRKESSMELNHQVSKIKQ